MLRLRLETPCYYSVFFGPSTNLKNLTKSIGRELAYLFQIEDSTEKVTQRHQQNGAFKVNRTRDTIKALFWMVVAILIPLLLGL